MDVQFSKRSELKLKHFLSFWSFYLLSVEEPGVFLMKLQQRPQTPVAIVETGYPKDFVTLSVASNLKRK